MELLALSESILIISGTLVLFAGMFYWLVLQTICGLVQVGLNDEMDVPMSFAYKTVEWLGIWFLYVNGAPYVAFFVMPWVIITTCSDFFAALSYYGIIEVNSIEQDDEEP